MTQAMPRTRFPDISTGLSAVASAKAEVSAASRSGEIYFF
jgi:hypothetical protein